MFNTCTHTTGTYPEKARRDVILLQNVIHDVGGWNAGKNKSGLKPLADLVLGGFLPIGMSESLCLIEGFLAVVGRDGVYQVQAVVGLVDVVKCPGHCKFRVARIVDRKNDVSLSCGVTWSLGALGGLTTCNLGCDTSVSFANSWVQGPCSHMLRLRRNSCANRYNECPRAGCA